MAQPGEAAAAGAPLSVMLHIIDDSLALSYASHLISFLPCILVSSVSLAPLHPPRNELPAYMTTKWHLGDSGLNYNLVAVFGSQSTGKSKMCLCHSVSCQCRCSPFPIPFPSLLSSSLSPPLQARCSTCSFRPPLISCRNPGGSRPPKASGFPPILCFLLTSFSSSSSSHRTLAFSGQARKHPRHGC